MAKTNFNFQATLKLQSKEFQKGVRDIQKSLAGLKASFMNFVSALGLTLGLGKFISLMKDTSIQLDTAKNVLKNVSESTVEYTESMIYLRKISNDYGQDLITLINNFGQFRAAAKDSGIEIDGLRSIYGSLVRAAGAFHLSAEKTNDMMLAVTQMFSKGKVSSEELRRQLGNVLPGAFNIMAKAAGMAGITTNGTTAELEDMMKKGKVLAKDVMPAFAALLDEITANASFDSLQGSLNRLKNDWTAFVEKADFAGFFQKMVNGTSKALQTMTKDFSTFKALLIGAGSGILGSKIWKKGQKAVNEWEANLVKRIDDVGNAAEQAQAKYEKLFGDQFLIDYKTLKNAYVNPPNQKFAISEDQFRKGRDAILEYNKAMLEADKLSRQLGRPKILDKRDITALKKEIKEIGLDMRSDGKVAVDSMSLWQKSVTALRVGYAKLKAAISAAFSSVIIGAVIAAVSFLITKLVEAARETKRIKNIVEDSEKAIEAVSAAESETVVELRKCKKELTENEKGSLRFQKAVEGVNKVMGLTGDKAYTVESNIDDIVSAVDDWIAKLKEVARVQAIISKINELTAKNIELENENDLIKNDKNSYWYKGARGMDENLMRTKYHERLAKNTLEIAQNNKAIDNLTSKLDAEGLDQLYGKHNDGPEIINNSGNTSGHTETKGKTKLDDVKDLFENYDKEIKKLENQLKGGAITADEYQKELDRLIDSTYKSAAAFGDLNEYLKGFGKGNIDKFKKRIADLKLDFDDIVDDKYDDQQKEVGQKLIDKIERQITKGLEQGVKDRKAQDIYANIRGPKERDTTFDYKLEKVDIAKEDYDNIKEYLDHLRELRKELINLGQTGTEQFQQLNILIGEAAQAATTFRDRAKLAEWKKDIEELSKTYREQMYGSIRDVASSFERLYNVYKDFASVFGTDIDPDGNFQKILTIFGALFETFETIYSVVQSLNTLQQTQAALEKAQNDEKMRALEAQIGLEAGLGAAKVAASEAATAAMAGEAVAAKALGVALKDAAAGAAAANAMQVPYPGNLAALASNIAAIGAAYGSIKAFAKGGVVTGGPKTGDHTLIRANAGELVLNGKQQSTLFNMLNGKAGMGGGQVEFKIRGDSLYGCLENYKIKRKG